MCEAQVPFVQGGAELLVRALVSQLQQRGYEAELVSVPFKGGPPEELLAHAAAWRLLDLSESHRQPIDLCIAMKFPTYFVRHPRKVAWLMHQHRPAYDLCGTPYSDFTHADRDVGLRSTLIRLDTEILGEARHLYTISRNTSNRLAKYNGLRGEPLYPPPPFADRLEPGPYGDYVLSVGRLEATKRPELAVEAMRHVSPPTRLVLVGDGPLRATLEATVESHGLADRVTFAGAVDESTLLDLYREALGIVYVPYDEDYGFVTLEAFLAQKPVVTVTDAGGPLEFVEDGVTGEVTPPDARALADAIARLVGNVGRAERLGQAGFDRARLVTWDQVIEKLTAPGHDD